MTKGHPPTLVLGGRPFVSVGGLLNMQIFVKIHRVYILRRIYTWYVTYVSIYRTGWEHEKCPVYHEFRSTGAQFGWRAEFRRPRIIQLIVNSCVSEPGIPRHICMLYTFSCLQSTKNAKLTPANNYASNQAWSSGIHDVHAKALEKLTPSQGVW